MLLDAVRRDCWDASLITATHWSELCSRTVVDYHSVDDPAHAYLVLRSETDKLRRLQAGGRPCNPVSGRIVMMAYYTTSR